MDSYAADVTQLQQLFTRFESQIEEIQAAKKSQSSSANKQLYLARATYGTLSTSLQNLERLAEIYNTDNTKFTTVNKSEKQKRVQKIADFGERLRRLHADFSRLESSSGSVNDLETGINRERTEDGEYESTKGKTN